jgi:hypothetical protein
MELEAHDDPDERQQGPNAIHQAPAKSKARAGQREGQSERESFGLSGQQQPQPDAQESAERGHNEDE